MLSGLYTGCLANKERLCIMMRDALHVLKYKGGGVFSFERSFKEVGRSPVPGAGILTVLGSHRDDLVPALGENGIVSFTGKNIEFWGRNGLLDAVANNNSMDKNKRTEGAELVPDSPNGAVIVTAYRGTKKKKAYYTYSKEISTLEGQAHELTLETVSLV
jgi:hypothetical protein